MHPAPVHSRPPPPIDWPRAPSGQRAVPAAWASAQALVGAVCTCPGPGPQVCVSPAGEVDLLFRRGANDLLEVRARADGRLDYHVQFVEHADVVRDWGADGLAVEDFPTRLVEGFLAGDSIDALQSCSHPFPAGVIVSLCQPQARQALAASQWTAADGVNME